MNYKILVNKENKIPKDFKVELVSVDSKYKKGMLLEKKTYEMFNKMKEDAKRAGHIIDIESAYRTHEYQEKLFNDLVNEKGIEYAKKYIAKPYTSEHETGLAIDFCVYDGEKCITEHEIEHLEATKWVWDNGHKYGFILRYPKGKEYITGYNHEYWHIRYVDNLAPLLYKNNLTLEEYYKNY